MKNKLIFAMALIANVLFGQETTLNWELKHAKTGEVLPAGTHGSVQELLIAKGELPDPFYGKNEDLFGWIEDYVWEYNSKIEITEEMLKKDYIEIDFPGIDTYAEVFYNDSLIGFAQNAFRPYRFEVKSLSRIGKNELRVVFYPPVLYHKEMYNKAAYHLPAPNDHHPIAIAPYTRKPQYQFGWDWALRMNTIGFLKPVSVSAFNSASCIGFNIETTEIHSDYALISLDLLLAAYMKTELYSWESKLFGTMVFSEGASTLNRVERIEQPRLWWPRGQGEQYLYEDEWVLKNASGEVLFTKKVRFGIRHSELVMLPDQWGTSYEIRINGRPVFCKGGDYIPQDVFPSRVTDQDLRKMVENMAAANFNMVRIWGGGYYPDEAFYDACDELGIMVWQDFMFACSMYPGDPEFLRNVGEEADYQVPRIASHPSVVLFNGNNEVDVAWKNWGFQVRYNIYGKDAKEVEDSYERLFKMLLPGKVKEYSNVPYVHTSPLSNWGKDEFYNHGSQHYWGVWHGKDPMEDFARKIGRFNAEYGFQSFPEYSTLLKFSTKEEWDVQSEVMKHHQKSYVGNLMILKHAKNLFGMPETFEDFVYYSQLTQATAVSMAVTGHRLDRPRCMGTLFWQVNDCWPAPTWSSIDHYWNWKALQYWVKNDYEDVAVLRNQDVSGAYHYYLVSDVVDTFMCELYFSVYDLNGKELFRNNVSQLVRGVESTEICMTSLKNSYGQENVLIKFDWKDQNNQSHSRTFSQLPEQYVKAESRDVNLRILSHDPEKRSMTIVVSNKKYLRNFWLYSLKAGINFNLNFTDLVPGDHEFIIHYSGDVPILEDFGFKNL
jgi:beta-mannosidase